MDLRSYFKYSAPERYDNSSKKSELDEATPTLQAVDRETPIVDRDHNDTIGLYHKPEIVFIKGLPQ